MTAQPFHLAWFMNFRADDWNDQWGSGGQPWTGEFYIDMARALDRACFDYIIIEDTSMVPDAYGGSFELGLKHAVAPKHDPAPLVPLLAQATSGLGIVPTLSTSFYPPWLLARLCSTLDHITNGRLGWNIVTSAEDRAAQNFGMEKLFEHDVRYDMADEYVDLVSQLWESWEADAVVMNRETGVYADHTKVHTVDFEGRFYKSRGPLNTARSPQGRPVFVQAGASPKGRAFAAKTADSIIATATGVEGMKEYRDDIRSKMEAMGRKPDDCKVLFLVAPVLGETETEARDKLNRLATSIESIERNLALMSSITEVDFAKFDLDAPLPDVTTNGERGSLEKFVQKGSGKTLRQLATEGVSRSIELVGTPDSVAERMGEVMEEIGGDGFLITSPSMRLSRRYITEVTDGLVPALQRRGLARTNYTFNQFRDNLLEF
jgi:FMN-dependent oxidoreductase (nitrilotriacetate monooxygenase family)